MAIGDAYVVKADFKARLNIVGSAQDTVIDQTLLAASRYIDGLCGQEFNRTAAMTPTAKYITARYGDVLDVPNLVSVSALATDSGDRTYPTTWSVTDYDLFPFDAADEGRPYTQIQRSPLGSYSWPSSVRGVRITGIWGWPNIHPDIVQATMRYAERLWALSRAPLGLAGAGEFQSEIKGTDADVRALVGPFRAMTV